MASESKHNDSGFVLDEDKDKEVWSADKVAKGWDPDDYKLVAPKGRGKRKKRPKTPKQQKKWSYHLTDKAGRGSKKLVPPLNARTPFSEFVVGMDLNRFLGIWANNKACLTILNEEMKAEFGWLERNDIVVGKHPSFQDVNLKYMSWSFMLMLEYCYPDLMDSCTGTSTCLLMMITHVYETSTGDKGKCVTYTVTMLKHLNSIWQSLFYQPSIARSKSSAANYWRQQLFASLLGSDWWRSSFGPDKKSMKDALMKYGWHGGFQKVQIAAFEKAKATKVRQRDALVAPRIVEESHFKSGVLEIYNLIFPKTWKPGDDFEITDQKQCAAALCLIQLMCGSRSRGVVGVNWFDSVDYTFDQEYKDMMSLSSISNRYSGYLHCVLVRRITKEKDQTTREWLQDQAARLLKREDDLETYEDSSVTAKHTTIVKPILFMLIDRSYTNAAERKENIATDPTRAVDVFLDLVSKTRLYVKVHAEEKYPLVKWELSPLRHKIWGFSEEDTYQLKNNQNLTTHWNRQMNTIVKSVFKSFLRKGEGTHMLRRLYANRGFAFFSEGSMKEVAFTQLTLGHKGFETSLRYTSIIYKSSFALKKAETLDEAYLRKLSDLEARIARMEETKADAPKKRVVLLEDEKGSMKEVPKLPRAQRSADGTQPALDAIISRTKMAIEALRKYHINVTWTNIYALGAPRNVQAKEYIALDEKDMGHGSKKRKL